MLRAFRELWVIVVGMLASAAAGGDAAAGFPIAFVDPKTLRSVSAALRRGKGDRRSRSLPSCSDGRGRSCQGARAVLPRRPGVALRSVKMIFWVMLLFTIILYISSIFVTEHIGQSKAYQPQPLNGLKK